MVIKIMKKFVFLFFTLIGFTSCIDSLVESFMGVTTVKYFSTDTSNLIIDNPKTVYNVGDTLKLRYVFPNNFIGTKSDSPVKDTYVTDIHKTFPELEQELFTFRYRTIHNRLIKDGQEVSSYKEILQYDETQNAYVSQPILLLLKREGTYEVSDYNFFEVDIISVSKIIRNKKEKINALKIKVNNGDKTFKVEP